jgi:hypothetical protein
MPVNPEINMVFPRHRRYSYKRWQHSAFAIRLRALLRGYQHQLARVDQAILEIRRQIGEAHTPTAQATPDGRGRSATAQLSTTVIKRIASARKGRRTEHKARKPNHP